MSSLFLPFLICSAMAFGALVLSCLTWFGVRAVSRAGAGAGAARRQGAAAVEAMEARLDALSSEIERLQRQPATVVAAGLPKPGFNLSKRTQALRMHRLGDSAERIASSLEIPRQEVDLLVKVHQIVIGNI